MKKQYKIIGIAAALMLAVACLPGCAGSSYRDAADGMYATATEEMAYEESYADYDSAKAVSPAEYGLAANGMVEMESVEEPLPTEPDMPDTGASDPTLEAKLIYTAYARMETIEFDNTVNAIKERVTKAGGYIENSSLSDYGSYRYMSYTLRIPAEQYRYFCDTVDELGQVKNFNENVANISDTYYDTQSRLESAQARLKTLQDLLKQAENMEDIITIQEAISNCQYEVDYYAGNLRSYDSQVKYSTVNLEIQEVSRLSNQEEPAIGFGQELSQAFKRGMNNFKDGVKDIAVSVAENIIGWCIFAVIVVLGIIFGKKIVKKAKEKKRKEAEAYAAQRMAAAQRNMENVQALREQADKPSQSN